MRRLNLRRTGRAAQEELRKSEISCTLISNGGKQIYLQNGFKGFK